jgi:hypothetical protein
VFRKGDISTVFCAWKQSGMATRNEQLMFIRIIAKAKRYCSIKNVDFAQNVISVQEMSGKLSIKPERPFY